MPQERATIIGLVDKVFKLSHPMFRKKNLEKVITILNNNYYPVDFIFRTINDRILQLSLPANDKRVRNSTFFTVSYVYPLSDKIGKFIKKTLGLKWLALQF